MKMMGLRRLSLAVFLAAAYFGIASANTRCFSTVESNPQMMINAISEEMTPFISCPQNFTSEMYPIGTNGSESEYCCYALSNFKFYCCDADHSHYNTIVLATAAVGVILFYLCLLLLLFYGYCVLVEKCRPKNNHDRMYES